MPMPTIGGFGQTSVKALNGATLMRPSGARVLIQAIGRGRIVLIIH